MSAFFAHLNLRAAMAALVLVATPFAAKAAPLVFSFTIVDTFGYEGPVGGLETGLIYGLVDNTSSQAATDVVITGYSGTGGLTVPFDVTAAMIGEDANFFNVAGGAITGAQFGQTFAGGALYLNYYGYNEVQYPSNSGNVSGFAGATYAQVTDAPVPEPASIALFGLGIFGLALRRSRRAAIGA